MSITRRFLIRAGFHSGPLSRRLDRTEAWSQLAIIVAFVILVIPATWYVAGSVGRTGLEQERAQQANRFQVTATLLDTAPLPAGDAGSTALPTSVTAQWRTVQGNPRSGTVRAVPGTPAGSKVTVWTDASGNPAPPPITREDTAAAVFGSAFLVVLAAGSAMLGIRALIHRSFERRRFEQWDQEWSLAGPDWNRLP